METNDGFEVIEQDWKECKYCGRSYYEYDTGYAEYECALWGGDPCLGGSIEGCLLSFRYKVEKK